MDLPPEVSALDAGMQAIERAMGLRRRVTYAALAVHDEVTWRGRRFSVVSKHPTEGVLLRLVSPASDGIRLFRLFRHQVDGEECLERLA